MNYEKMYHLLFNAITDALEQMEKQNLGSAKDLPTNPRRAQQCCIPQAVCRRATVTRASRSKARLRPVATRRDSWRSHVHRTQFRRPRSSSSYNLPMQNFSRGIERGILSFEREYPPFIRAVPSALLFPLHAQREKPPLICKDKKTTPRCCEFLRSAIRQR